MKELDIKAIEAVLKDEINSINLKYLIVFIILNLIIASANWLIQRNVKSLDSTVYRKKVREDKRIIVIETIYKNLVEFTYILNTTEMKASIEKLSSLENYISQNKLYISKSLHKKIIGFTDYLKNIIADFRKKDYATESKLLTEIENEFNR